MSTISNESVSDIFKGIRKIFADKKPTHHKEVWRSENLNVHIENLKKTFLNDKWLDQCTFKDTVSSDGIAQYFTIENKVANYPLFVIDDVIERANRLSSEYRRAVKPIHDKIINLDKAAKQKFKSSGKSEETEEFLKATIEKFNSLKLPTNIIFSYKKGFFNNEIFKKDKFGHYGLYRDKDVKVPQTIKAVTREDIEKVVYILIDAFKEQDHWKKSKEDQFYWLDHSDGSELNYYLDEIDLLDDYYDKWYFQTVDAEGGSYSNLEDIIDVTDYVKYLSLWLERSVIGPKDKISNESFKGVKMSKNLEWVLGLEDSEGEAKPVDVETPAGAEPEDGVDEDTPETNVDEMDIDISIEDYIRVSGEDGGKVIDGQHHDDVSGTYKRYVIGGFDATTNPAAESTDNKQALVILLQNGLIQENGINGVTIEDLLIVCENIMEGYQSTKFNCPENQTVLESIQTALGALRSRRERRSEQGTLDTHVPETNTVE